MRHTYVATLIARGEHPRVIQTRLGHSSIKVILGRYGHLFEGLDEAAAARLEEASVAGRAEQAGSDGRRAPPYQQRTPENIGVSVVELRGFDPLTP